MATLFCIRRRRRRRQSETRQRNEEDNSLPSLTLSCFSLSLLGGNFNDPLHFFYIILLTWHHCCIWVPIPDFWLCLELCEIARFLRFSLNVARRRCVCVCMFIISQRRKNFNNLFTIQYKYLYSLLCMPSSDDQLWSHKRNQDKRNETAVQALQDLQRLQINVYRSAIINDHHQWEH